MLSKKENCNKCNKSFTLKTLNKNNGICGRCAKPKSNFKREKISSITREHVWNKTYGNSIKGICNVCRINIISPFNFECGHDIAVSKGGSNDVSNLSAICNKCNKSMGIKTFKEVMGEISVILTSFLYVCNKYWVNI